MHISLPTMLLILTLSVSGSEVRKAYPVVTSPDEYEALKAGDHYWRHGELLEKHVFGTATPTPTPVRSYPYIVEQSELDRLQVGTTFWYHDRLFIKNVEAAMLPELEPAPTPEPTATPESRPTPIPGYPVVVSWEDYNHLAVGTTYWWRDRLWVKPEPTPTTVVKTTPIPQTASSTPVLHQLLLLFLVFGGIVFGLWRLIYGIKPKSAPQAGPTHKKEAQIYYNYPQFEMALKIWQKDVLLFEHAETARLAALEAGIKEKTPLGAGVGLVSIIIAILVGMSAGAGFGWGVFWVGIVISGAIGNGEMSFRRWYHQVDFIRRQFSDPEPVFVQRAEPPPRQEPPPKQEAPPPRSASPPPRQEPTNGKRQPVKVVSRPQACQILGISPTATLSEAKVAYRALVLLYHPDYVDRLGPELKEVAHIKTTEFNAAMAFIVKG